jgi:hypothetical protein
VEPALRDRYDPANVPEIGARATRNLRGDAARDPATSKRFASVEPSEGTATMIHFQRTSFLRGACGVALTSLAFSALALAQNSKSDVAPGTPAANPQASPAAGTTKEKAKYLRYMRVGKDGGSARNLGDSNGVSVGKLSAGTLVAVYEEHGDWLECEVPGGFEIWVYGQYIKPSSEAGVLEISGSDVRARPLASSGPESYPLQPNLSRGERVRLIARNDSGKPLAEDWIKVYSPPGVRGFVAKSDCEALAAGTDGSAAWATAVIEARKRTPATAIVAAAPVAAKAGGSAVVGDLTPQQAVEELKSADIALARERVAANPNYAPIKEQYEHVAASVKEGATHDLAQRGVQEVDLLLQASALTVALQAERDNLVAESIKRQDELNKIKNNPDIYSGRFLTRGWVEKREVQGQPATFMLRWAGGQSSQIQCNSGRYDLAAFQGYEVGVNGTELRAYTPGDISHVAVPRLVDAERIEVISGRQAR